MGFALCLCKTKVKLAIKHNGGIMEDILELILTILFKPFESKFDNIFGRINNIHSKGSRVLLRIVQKKDTFGYYQTGRGRRLRRPVNTTNTINGNW